MEKLTKEEIQEAKKYPPKEFKNLSAEEILKWLEQTKRFLRKFLTPEEIIRWREINKI